MKRVVALLAARQELTIAQAERALGPEGAVVESELVRADLAALTEALEDSEIVIVADPAIGPESETLMWIHSLRPLADVWRICKGARSERPALEFDDEVELSLFQSGGGGLLRERLKRRLRQKDLLASAGIVSKSQRMGLLAETIERVAPTDVSVLIVGPSGAGKEIIAKAIHQMSDRKDEPFVALNCGAIPEGLIESELFGHEKGAFSGSVSKRAGYFTQADGGTILLDEIGEMKPDMQVKLLRALEEGVFYPLGSDKPQRVNVRAIAATNRDLEQAINSGGFRDDLYFRLAGVKLVAPALTERREDILPLLALFSSESRLSGFSAEALAELQSFDWPGNVRQLKNFVARMSALIGDGEVSLADVRRYTSEQGFRRRSLPAVAGEAEPQIGQELIYRALLSLGAEVKGLRDLMTANIPTGATVSRADYSDVTDVTDVSALDTEDDINNLSMQEGASEIGSLEEMEAQLMEQTLRDTGGNRRLTAERLGIGERTLYRKLKKYGLS